MTTQILSFNNATATHMIPFTWHSISKLLSKTDDNNIEELIQESLDKKKFSKN